MPTLGEHAAPVGVLAVDRALDQVRPRHRARGRDGVVLGCRAAARRCGCPWWRPRRRPTSWRARSSHTAVTAASRSSCAGAVPEAPLASSSTVSLVDMQPSVSTRSKVTRVALRSTESSVAASATASVVTTTSMVASDGASMPAPLAMPPTVKPSPVAVASLGHRVGGHDGLGRFGSAVGLRRRAHASVDAGEAACPSAAARR